ncbi:MAG: UDP-N-acetylmuramate--L-alanine ligase [Termitinemataceae bacterium]|nr:MAG: UDP-N-acetylmuramate--L-alanine ligase [Termitinemataceae bacterium]
MEYCSQISIETLFKKDSFVYMIGIKGTGMCAFAELLHYNKIRVCGSDTPDVFYTDAILKSLNIAYYEGFEPSNVPLNADLIIHSAAYTPENNCEVAAALSLNTPLVKYTEALGAYSALFDSAGVAGVHGKTTTTALCGVVAAALKLPAQILAGSAVSNFGSGCNGARCTLFLGNEYFIAETCEYRKHFLSFNPKRIILTSVESDHQDFFPTYNSIRDAFLEYVTKLTCNDCEQKKEAMLIYCADDLGASEVAAMLKKTAAADCAVRYVPYGFSADGDYKITDYKTENEKAYFELAGFKQQFSLRVSGRHNALNATAALALCAGIANEKNMLTQAHIKNAAAALDDFKGSKRRLEILGEANGILFIDDYAHHPTAIKTTLAGLKDFYPQRRIVVSFMPHTYTRTHALLDEFASAFTYADVLVLHKIYSSARETAIPGISGETLFKKTEKIFLQNNKNAVYYFAEPCDADVMLKSFLQSKDLFITMGAGDNWKLGKLLYDEMRQK